MSTLVQLLGFLLEHADLIEAIAKAIKAGTPKEAIAEAIEQAKVAASDAAFKEELGID